MNQSEKYNKIIDLLRKSKPALGSQSEIEEQILNRLTRVSTFKTFMSDTVEFLFRWVYIGSVRRVLVTASVALVLLFAYQQTVILRKIDVLSRQTIVNKADKQINAGEVEKLLMNYRYSGRKFSSDNIVVSEKQMKELIESINELQIKYRDLENLIEGDPEIKKLIENKLNELDKQKI